MGIAVSYTSIKKKNVKETYSKWYFKKSDGSVLQQHFVQEDKLQGLEANGTWTPQQEQEVGGSHAPGRQSDTEEWGMYGLALLAQLK